MDSFFKSEGFDTNGFEEPVWRRPAVMTSLKQDLLSRFVGTDEGEVTEYLGCEIIRDREDRTAKIVESGYAERVLKTFGMWDCNPVNREL